MVAHLGKGSVYVCVGAGVPPFGAAVLAQLGPQLIQPKIQLG